MTLLLTMAFGAALAGMAPDDARPRVQTEKPQTILALGGGGKTGGGRGGGFGKWRKGDLKSDFGGAVNPRPPSGPKGGGKSGTTGTNGTGSNSSPVLRPRGPVFRPGGI